MLENVSHFTEDVSNLNNYCEFSQTFRIIYPYVIQLKSEHHRLYAIFLELKTLFIDGICEYNKVLGKGR